MTKETKSTDFIQCQPTKGWALIQRNSQPARKLDEDNLAFDKCTLLSSQGSDAPTHPPTKARRAGQLHNHTPPRSQPTSQHGTDQKTCAPETSCHEGGTTILTAKADEPQPELQSKRRGLVRQLEGGEAFRPFRFPVGRTSNNLRGIPPTSKSPPHPGRVAKSALGSTPDVTS